MSAMVGCFSHLQEINIEKKKKKAHILKKMQKLKKKKKHMTMNATGAHKIY